MRIILLGLIVFSLVALGTLSLLTAIYRKGRRRIGDDRHPYPFVSLLKPIKNVDDELAANVESYFTLDYPNYEVLFAVDELSDACVSILLDVQARHPHIPARLIATGHNQTQNPKIHKLSRLESLARGDWYWVTDSNVRVEPGTLKALVDESRRSGARLVFGLVRGSASRTFGSLMENTSLNLLTSGAIIAAWKFFRQHILVGKSFLVERRAIETFGGFSYLKDYLAEDFLLGEAFSKSRFTISTNYTWVTNISIRATPRSFSDRMSRWAKLRFQLRRPVYVLEILLNPVVIALLAWPFLGRVGLPVLGLVAGLKVAFEYLTFLAINTLDRRKARFHLLFPVAVLAKDLLLLGVYFTPFFSRSVRWRGGRITIGRQTLISLPDNVDNLAYEGA